MLNLLSVRQDAKEKKSVNTAEQSGTSFIYLAGVLPMDQERS